MKTLLLRAIIPAICLASTTALMAQDPRTPISTVPYTITTQGSYYVTDNLVATGSNSGITIAADNVTLDLNGFAVVGGGSGQVAGITVSGTHKNIYIKNGTVRGWTAGGVNAFNASNSVIQGLRISNNGAPSTFVNVAGISIGAGSTVKDSFVAQNANCNGISTGNACLVTNCVVRFNAGGAGIRAGDLCYILNNVSDSNNTGISMGSGNRIESNNCSSNTGAGFLVPSGYTNNMLVRNSARSNDPNYNIAAGNRYGPISNITPANTGAAYGDAAPATIVTSHPWANFAY